MKIVKVAYSAGATDEESGGGESDKYLQSVIWEKGYIEDGFQYQWEWFVLMEQWQNSL